MRHCKNKKAGVSKSHHKANVRNLVISLVLHEKIVTTQKKANFAASKFENVFSRVLKEKDAFGKKRILEKELGHKEAQKKVLKELVPKFQDKKGYGFTRVLKIGPRQGDNALLCRLEIKS